MTTGPTGEVDLDRPRRVDVADAVEHRQRHIGLAHAAILEQECVLLVLDDLAVEPVGRGTAPDLPRLGHGPDPEGGKTIWSVRGR